MPIDPSLEQGAFGPEATAAMGEAFDAACKGLRDVGKAELVRELVAKRIIAPARPDRKSTRLNSSHTVISYAVFCLKKKKKYIKNLLGRARSQSDRSIGVSRL